MSSAAFDAAGGRLAPGYIFIGEGSERAPEAYRAWWGGAWGFFARITPHHFSGHYPVTVEEYAVAADAHRILIIQRKVFDECSVEHKAAEQAFFDQLEVDPAADCIIALVDAATKSRSDLMHMHAMHVHLTNRWEAASRDVQTTEELHAREQAFADEVEACGCVPLSAQDAGKVLMH